MVLEDQDRTPNAEVLKYSPLAGSFLWGLFFGLTIFFFEAWFWLCSLHFFNWKLINFHIIQACVRQIAARQVILSHGRDTKWNDSAAILSFLSTAALVNCLNTRHYKLFPSAWTCLIVSTLKLPSDREKPWFSVRGSPKPNVRTERVRVRRRAMTKSSAQRVKL